MAVLVLLDWISALQVIRALQGMTRCHLMVRSEERVEIAAALRSASFLWLFLCVSRVMTQNSSGNLAEI